MKLDRTPRLARHPETGRPRLEPTFAAELRELLWRRLGRGTMPIDRLAKLARVSPSTLNRWMYGLTAGPRLTTVERVLEALGCDLPIVEGGDPGGIDRRPH
jgi:transcriptional regulator with XRE-family HTH domain